MTKREKTTEKGQQHVENNPEYRGLAVNKGIERPSSINEGAIKRFRVRKRQQLSVDQYVEGILDHDRTILSRAITLIESSLRSHQEVAQEIIKKCLPYSGNSVRIGITGVPGVGKSTFIEALGVQITRSNRKLAVLAIDPSSERSKGSILGDKTRMETLCNDPNAFIRPSPSAGSLGGVARKTRESIILCEAAGFDTIFIETVGVGQSETAVHSMVDFFLLLMLAGAGDELQGIKRGIMEMAEAIVITKADGGNEHKAGLAKIEYQNALHLFPPTENGWEPKVLTCSAVTNNGLLDVWNSVMQYISHVKGNGHFLKRRNFQAKYWMYESINEALKGDFYQHPKIKSILPKIEQAILDDKKTSFAAASELLRVYYQELGE